MESSSVRNIAEIVEALKQSTESDESSCTLVDQIHSACLSKNPQYRENQIQAANIGAVHELSKLAQPGVSSPEVQGRAFQTLGQLCFNNIEVGDIIGENDQYLHACLTTLQGLHENDETSKMMAISSLSNVATVSCVNHPRLLRTVPFVIGILQDTQAKKLMRSYCVTFLGNLARNQTNHPALESAIEPLINVVMSADPELGFVTSAEAVAHLTGDQETGLSMQARKKIAQHLISALKASLVDKDYPTGSCLLYESKGLADAITIFAYTQANRRQLLNFGIVSTIREVFVLKRPSLPIENAKSNDGDSKDLLNQMLNTLVLMTAYQPACEVIAADGVLMKNLRTLKRSSTGNVESAFATKALKNVYSTGTPSRRTRSLQGHASQTSINHTNSNGFSSEQDNNMSNSRSEEVGSEVCYSTRSPDKSDHGSSNSSKGSKGRKSMPGQSSKSISQKKWIQSPKILKPVESLARRVTRTKTTEICEKSPIPSRYSLARNFTRTESPNRSASLIQPRGRFSAPRKSKPNKLTRAHRSSSLGARAVEHTQARRLHRSETPPPGTTQHRRSLDSPPKKWKSLPKSITALAEILRVGVADEVKEAAMRSMCLECCRSDISATEIISIQRALVDLGIFVDLIGLSRVNTSSNSLRMMAFESMGCLCKENLLTSRELTEYSGYFESIELALDFDSVDMYSTSIAEMAVFSAVVISETYLESTRGRTKPTPPTSEVIDALTGIARLAITAVQYHDAENTSDPVAPLKEHCARLIGYLALDLRSRPALQAAKAGEFLCDMIKAASTRQDHTLQDAKNAWAIVHLVSGGRTFTIFDKGVSVEVCDELLRSFSAGLESLKAQQLPSTNSPTDQDPLSPEMTAEAIAILCQNQSCRAILVENGLVTLLFEALDDTLTNETKAMESHTRSNEPQVLDNLLLHSRTLDCAWHVALDPTGLDLMQRDEPFLKCIQDVCTSRFMSQSTALIARKSLSLLTMVSPDRAAFVCRTGRPNTGTPNQNAIKRKNVLFVGSDTKNSTSVSEISSSSGTCDRESTVKVEYSKVMKSQPEAKVGKKSSVNLVENYHKNVILLENLYDWSKKPFARGGSASVFTVRYQGELCAAKILDLRSFTDEYQAAAKKAFLTEISTLQSLSSSPRVLRFYGACKSEDLQKLAVVMEYAQNGTLRSFLDQSKKPRLAVKQRLLTEIAFGMEYLASQGITHRDLKSTNVLLDDRLGCKIADFGLSKIDTGGCTTIANSFRGTFEFAAPEVLDGQKCTEKGDSYAYGIMIWEVLSLLRPWAGKSPGEIVASVISRRRPEKYSLPRDVPRALVNLMERCWDHDAENRPGFHDIVIVLTQ